MLPSLRPNEPQWTNRRLSTTKRLMELQRLVAGAPSDTPVRRELAALQADLGDYEAAEKNLEAVVELCGAETEADVFVLLARARFGLWALSSTKAVDRVVAERLESAAAAFRRALELRGARATPEYVLEAAQVLLLSGDVRLACDLLTQLVTHFPKWPRLNEAAFLCGVVLFHFGEFSNAIGYLQFAVLSPPPGVSETRVALRLGRAYEKVGKPDLAGIAFEKGFERGAGGHARWEAWHDDPATWEARVQTYLDDRDVIFAADAAQQALKRLHARLSKARDARTQIKLRERSVPLFLQLADCRERLGDADAARQLVAQAYEWGPFDWRTRQHQRRHLGEEACAHFAAQEEAATRIQQWIRRFNAKCHLIALQHYRERLRDRLSRQLALIWRAHDARAQLARRRLERDSATVIQRAFARVFWPQAAAVVLRIRRHRGAIAMQRVRRGAAARADLRRQGRHATFIQNRARGMLVRNEQRRRHAAATVLEAAVRGLLVRLRLRRRYLGSDARRTFATPEFDGDEAAIMSCWHVTREGKGWLPFAACADADAVAEMAMANNRAVVFNSPSLSAWDVHRMCRLLRLTATPELHTVMLYGAHIPDSSAFDLCRTLGAMPGLTALGLGTSNLSEASVGALADALERGAFRLRKLFVEHGPGIGDEQVLRIVRAVRPQGCLERLQLSGLGVTDVTVCECAQLAEDVPSLNTLGLDYNRVSDAGVQALAGALLRRGAGLATLRLAHNPGIGDAGAVALAGALRAPAGCPLRELDLCGTAVGDAGALELAVALRANDTLTSLFVADCDIGPDGFDALKRVRGVNDVFLNLAVNFRTARERVLTWRPF